MGQPRNCWLISIDWNSLNVTWHIPIVRLHGARMLLAIFNRKWQLLSDSNKKKVTLPKQEWGVVQVCCVCVCFFSTMSTAGGGRRRRVTAICLPCKHFSCFSKVPKSMSREQKQKQQQMLPTSATVKRVTHCAYDVFVVFIVVVVDVSLMRKVYTLAKKLWFILHIQMRVPPY